VNFEADGSQCFADGIDVVEDECEIVITCKESTRGSRWEVSACVNELICMSQRTI
jgi:hypothetical protein